MAPDPKGIAVVYLARGHEADCTSHFTRFIDSYRGTRAGVDHDLHIVFKGFNSAAALLSAQAMFAVISDKQLIVNDDAYDIGAYADACRHLRERFGVFLNTYSVMAADGWLYKLHQAMSAAGVGLVGATGSFEQLTIDGCVEAPFPNVHIRTNAFMIDLMTFRDFVSGCAFQSKRALYELEAGTASITRRTLARGFSVAVVGRNGRAYSPEWWPISDTFRQGVQENLLCRDNQTEAYARSIWSHKRMLCERTWGKYLDPASGHIFRNPSLASAVPRYRPAL